MNESHREPTLNLNLARAYLFAQEVLGHNNRAVHEAYANRALIILPPLDEYEQMQTNKVIPLALNRREFRLV